MENVGVEATAGGGQSTQGAEHEPRLLPRHGLLNLLHVLLDVWQGKTGQTYIFIFHSTLNALQLTEMIPFVVCTGASIITHYLISVHEQNVL